MIDTTSWHKLTTENVEVISIKLEDKNLKDGNFLPSNLKSQLKNIRKIGIIKMESKLYIKMKHKGTIIENIPFAIAFTRKKYNHGHKGSNVQDLHREN